MNTEHCLSRHVHSFFHDYLVRQRDLSPNTVLSYRDTLKLFLQFATIHLGKPVVDLSLDSLDVDLVLLFLDHLEEQRNNSVATRNVRLAALHTFFRHVGGQEPLHLDQCRRIVDIPLKRYRPRPSTISNEKSWRRSSTPSINRHPAAVVTLLCSAWHTRPGLASRNS